MQARYNFVDSNITEWVQLGIEGVEIKTLACANDQVMELYRFAPNIVFPDHIHQGPEFVFLMEGSARVDGKWIYPGWSSAAETGTTDKEFLSGELGCIFLSVYTSGSEFI